MELCNHICYASEKRTWLGYITLKRDPMEENFDDLDESSGSGGNRLAAKEHLDAVNRAWCSATT